MLLWSYNAAAAVAASTTVYSPWVDLGADFKRLPIEAKIENGVASVGAVLSLEEGAADTASAAIETAPNYGGDNRPISGTSGAAAQDVAGRANKRYVRAKFVNGTTAQGATFNVKLGVHVRR